MENLLIRFAANELPHSLAREIVNSVQTQSGHPSGNSEKIAPVAKTST